MADSFGANKTPSKHVHRSKDSGLNALQKEALSGRAGVYRRWVVACLIAPSLARALLEQDAAAYHVDCSSLLPLLTAGCCDEEAVQRFKEDPTRRQSGTCGTRKQDTKRDNRGRKSAYAISSEVQTSR